MLGHNSVIFMIESQVNYILQLIKLVDTTKTQAVEVKVQVQNNFNETIQKQLQGTVWQAGGCVSWYQTSEGKNFSLWPTYTWKYWLETRKINVSDYHFLGDIQAKKIAV
ncbi:hypothetical protein QE384_003226 [Acinetobacter baylyi]|nr:hypothetical protein [Acinetobacter baylyi]